jgi:hypothetical protein
MPDSRKIICVQRLSFDRRYHSSSYWVPNVLGGLVTSTSEWDLNSNIKYAHTAEKVGFEYALTQIRFMASYGAVSMIPFDLASVSTNTCWIAERFVLPTSFGKNEQELWTDKNVRYRSTYSI